jgi:hypothetical protein
MIEMARLEGFEDSGIGRELERHLAEVNGIESASGTPLVPTMFVGGESHPTDTGPVGQPLTAVRSALIELDHLQVLTGVIAIWSKNIRFAWIEQKVF